MDQKNRLPATERYHRDNAFRVLVDSLYYQIHLGNYTPTELREAVILAAIKYEELNIKRAYFYENPIIAGDQI